MSTVDVLIPTYNRPHALAVTLTSLCAAIAARDPIRALAGHEHIAPDRKHDPGPGFDWALLQRLLSWPAGMFPPGQQA